jgi:diguanylate cyclase (GGDEF)-like protein/PAS domain S-box-containing protein
MSPPADGGSVTEDYEALLQFLYMAPIGLLQADLGGEIVMINPLCAQLLMPLAPGGQIANLFDAFETIAPDLRQRVAAFTEPRGHVVQGLEIPVYAGQGGRRDAQVLSLTLLRLDVGRLMAVIDDVTEVVRRERQLRHTQAWVETIVSGISDYALLELDDAGRVRGWNSSIGRLFGHDAGAVTGQPFSLFYPADTVPAVVVADRLDEARQTGWSLDEGWRERADGVRFWGSSLIAPLDVPGGEDNGFSLIVRDISDRREAREALRSAVHTDHLTGLANRRAFHELASLELHRWAASPRPVSLLLVDADHFKRINDTHGHAAGDAVLRQLAAALAAGLRSQDIVARLGGEEFVALLPGTSADGAEQLAIRLCAAIAGHPVRVEGHEIPCTVSIGVASLQPGIDTLDELLQRADCAMYAAKRGGRNRVVAWSPALAPVTKGRVAVTP